MSFTKSLRREREAVEKAQSRHVGMIILNRLRHPYISIIKCEVPRSGATQPSDIGGGFGIFTYALAQGLGPKSKEADINGNGVVEFMELVDYVSSFVDKETKGEQTPWLSRKELFGDLPIAMVYE